MDRRSALKTLGSAASAMAMPFHLQAAIQDPPCTLNCLNLPDHRLTVYFHGLHLLSFEGQVVVDYAPRVSGHYYKIGTGKGTDVSDGAFCHLQVGSSAAGTAMPDGNKFSLLSRREIHWKESFYRLALPPPDCIQPLRCFTVPSGKKLYSGKFQPGKTPKEVPLLLAFVYKDVSWAKVSQFGKPDLWEAQQVNAPLHLHVRSEPPSIDHPHDAMAGLRRVLGIKNDRDLKIHNDCNGKFGFAQYLDGFPLEEQCHLFEYNQDHECKPIKTAEQLTDARNATQKASDGGHTEIRIFRPSDCKAWGME